MGEKIEASFRGFASGGRNEAGARVETGWGAGNPQEGPVGDVGFGRRADCAPWFPLQDESRLLPGAAHLIRSAPLPHLGLQPSAQARSPGQCLTWPLGWVSCALLPLCQLSAPWEPGLPLSMITVPRPGSDQELGNPEGRVSTGGSAKTRRARESGRWAAPRLNASPTVAAVQWSPPPRRTCVSLVFSFLYKVAGELRLGP